MKDAAERKDDPMVNPVKRGIYLLKGQLVLEDTGPLDVDQVNNRLSRAGLAPLSEKSIDKERAREGTISSQILRSHNRSEDRRHLKLQLDVLTSHDITYVGTIQTARTSGLAGCLINCYANG
jgi:aconitate hydratase